jgi:predicted esterase
MKTTSGKQRTKVSFAPLVSLLWLAMLFCGAVTADEAPTGRDFEIETTPLELLGEEGAARYRKILDPDDPVSWAVYYPAHAEERLPGVFVYISPGNSGRIDPRWRRVMDERNLVYIAAHQSGNRVRTNRRMVLAVFALRALEGRVPFDASKLHVSGFSGGGRVASLVASQYPEAFTAALYICGVNFWKKSQTPSVDRVIQNRFVFLTGSRDFNLAETRRVHQRYLKAGALNSELMIVPGMGHELPDAAWLTRALRYLAGEELD